MNRLMQSLPRALSTPSARSECKGIALAQAQADAVESMRATLDTVATAADLSEVATKVNDILSDLDV